MNASDREMVEALVLKFGDDLCEENNQSSLKIMRLTSELAKLSCQRQTLHSFQTSGFTSISFTGEERNAFARFQILSNQIRKSHNFHELPLFHLSPRLVLSSVLSIENFQELSLGNEGKIPPQNVHDIIPKKKKKNAKSKPSNSGKQLPTPPENTQSSSPHIIKLIPNHSPETEPSGAVVEAKLSLDADYSDIKAISSSQSRKPKIPVDEPPQTIFFREELDPTDLDGWVPVLNKKKDVIISSQKKMSTTKSYLPKSCQSPLQQTPSNLSSPCKPNSIAHEPSRSVQMIDLPTFPLSSSPTRTPTLNSSPSRCQNCVSLQNALTHQELKHSSDLQLLRSQYEEEIQNLRELNSQAIQSLQLKLFISNNNLEIEREERNKIIEEILSKYRCTDNGSDM
jgi:hypothetical protein